MAKPLLNRKRSFLVLPYLGLQSKIITKQLKSCTNKVCGCVDLRIIFQNTHRMKSFSYKDRLTRALMSNVVYKTGFWDCNDICVGKTKPRLRDLKTEHFKALSKRYNMYVSLFFLYHGF